MGLKRKASLSLSPTSSTPGISPNQNYSSYFQTVKPSDKHAYSTATVSSKTEPYLAEAPTFLDRSPGYLNSRTRKRLRDNRPDENVIHQNTLNKLFAAQKQNQTSPEARSTSIGYAYGSERDLAAAAASPSSAHFRHEYSISQVAGPAQLYQTPKTKGQRSLDGFLTGSGSRTNSIPKVALPSSSFLPPAPPLRNTSITSIRSNHGPAMIMTCEDCFAPLLTATSRNAVDVEMMDVDGPLIECEIDEGWECGRCRKRVCDTCAVRRTLRLCLECANPGHGFYDAMEIGEKRWVGGIGWM